MIGKVNQIISMTNYLCSIFQEGEHEIVPTLDDYKFGTMVKIELKQQTIVGIITNISTVTPGDRIPLKLSDAGQAQRLYPSFYSSIQTFVTVCYLGSIRKEGEKLIVSHGFPKQIAEVGQAVWKMTGDEITTFHKPLGKMAFGYYSRFAKEQNFEYVFVNLCEQLMEICPDEAKLIKKLKQNVEFLSKVKGISAGMGGY